MRVLRILVSACGCRNRVVDPVLQGVGIGVVVHVERAITPGRDFERVARAGVVDRHGDAIVIRVPKERYLETVARAEREFLRPFGVGPVELGLRV
jgi:hypothetical protein